MGILDFFRGKPAETHKQADRPRAKSRDEKIRHLQLLLQSPYAEDREKALHNLRILGAGRKTSKALPRSDTPVVERIVLVLDRSGSMALPDYPPSRLRAAIEAAREMIGLRAERDPRDEVGVVWFDARARLLQGLTCLREGKDRLIRRLGTLRPDDGTDIDAGLRRARDLLGASSTGKQDRVVLLTDGHGGDPLGTARALKDRDVVIDVIGIGGSPAAVNERLLRKVASTINGDNRYRFIANRDELFKHFRQLADKLVK